MIGFVLGVLVTAGVFLFFIGRHNTKVQEAGDAFDSELDKIRKAGE